mmetsp:Transcript_2967/g.9082  ORF Transcript_2967/g.9082 Transcript_2967/m.9082 type:complete len:180 (-) Transcript_2967:174-713(-)|eukprot:CAMPEP_0198727870 /NCGR_PEP_ID=MMETSP1475-20131203/5987_1 /TAXON_ID= ORGANISM="Unidentified sp., Strain CCMP1999" /NCGR_SAMPLE_ID=MMETSP1475 /ASSEMBLY_ACC=CAM_ASM_001111 /LENGTH=179 /DNA_ID=CAMNT_0044490063 /DNA_START=65 /DNA_END=604 /DNA_ORIENTATION=-
MAFAGAFGAGIDCRTHRRQCTCSASVPRREFLLAGAGALVAMFGLNSGANAAEKPGLPPGAMQFDRVLKAQKNWEEIGGLVSNKRQDMAGSDWDGIRAFLRKFYRIGDDFDYLGGNLSKENRNKISALAKEFRKNVKELDKPAGSKDVDQFLTGHKNVNGQINEFFTLLRSDSDVPDEL